MNTCRGCPSFISVLLLLILSISTAPLAAGFKSLADPEDRSCMEAQVCHDISDYRRTTEGEAYPYEHCICHGEIPDGGLAIEVRGKRIAEVNEKIKFIVTIHGCMGKSFGFAVNATNGALPEKFQFSPLETNQFELEYIAPSEPQTVRLTIVGLSADGDSEAKPKYGVNNTSGDSWNVHRIHVHVRESSADIDSNSPVFIILIITIAILIIILVYLKKRKHRKKF